MERLVTIRQVIIVLNLVALAAIAAYVIWAVLSPKRASQEIEPANLTPFLPDEDLESRRLERVQGWALLFAAVVAVSLPLYWLNEPSRQDDAITYFSENAADRGEVLYSNASMERYDSAQSLGCATCHGAKGQGGQAPFQVAGEAVVWQAPPLDTVLLRFQEDAGCASPETQPTSVCNVTQIITHGRPGTPMAAWGVEGGGPKNSQSIQDLVAYLRTIQLSPADAQKQATAALVAARSDNPGDACPQYMTCPDLQLDAARKKLEADTATLGKSRATAQKALGQPDATDAELATACADIKAQVKANAAKVKAQAIACDAYTEDAQTVADDEAAIAWNEDWVARRANVQDGQLLFELSCARCHTQGWSTFDSTVPEDAAGGADSLGLPGGGGGLGGGIGPNLRDDSEIRRFGTDVDGGFTDQLEFVQVGSIPAREYGTGGIGTGRMPGFAQILTEDQIKQIISYERYCLDSSTFAKAQPVCLTDPRPRVDPTTTTAAASAKG